ncbi:hypothetical protein SLEP1_g56732 [Rubroshorea leprosula]|uniref:Reverse transcriptase Ty1/copia-type domain-containing protein n=1 Tax=Rubroshorea leprosula TaxID=152421 RepID=A0AAV5MKI7_9ROSI|nr:hypothetical protein SLEP1_g56732 [Rubroshorea leprosula]
MEEAQAADIDLETNTNHPDQDQVVRPPRPQRERRVPQRLDDYVCTMPQSVMPMQAPSQSTNSGDPYALSNCVSYNSFSSTHLSYLAAISSVDEPKSFSQAIKNENWRKAMRQEIKFKPDGTVERYKARLVAKGFTQIEGLDFNETFAPVAKMVTVRTLLALASIKRWELHQLDVNNAFLQGDLHEEVYMKIPQGFTCNQSNKVCRLRKSLYGLRQASRNWFEKFTTSLEAVGFKQSKADYSLFTLAIADSFVAVLIYVDDIVITGNDGARIATLKHYLHSAFSIKDLGPLKYFLGIEVARTTEGIVLSQRKYALDILTESGMLGAKPSSFPMEQHHRLGLASGSPIPDPSQYRRLEHFDAAMKVLRYVKNSPGQGMLLSSSSHPHLVAYCDANWAGCPRTRRSTTAEYRAMASTVSELTWLKSLLYDLGIYHSKPMTLFCDNQAALHIANNLVFHARTKHIEIDCHFVRERIQRKELLTAHVPSHCQLADLFTKALGKERLHFLLYKLGIRDLHAPT